MMRTLERVKSSLRITHGKFDDTLLEPLIEACRRDLMAAGVSQENALSEVNILVERAIIHYCHINFPLNGDIRETERHERAYTSLRDRLALVGDDLSLKTY